ncbi:DUF748 domain-containing protein [Lacisediminimonas profundi]|uniref:DUF748 domain-containing protein n=1 Tax=Lacisediminimonas profundi TaxID=2603856 RepID=UPI00124BA5BE|nr:DUF748 domain-containing protein [Lacisediminimonas profundi]
MQTPAIPAFAKNPVLRKTLLWAVAVVLVLWAAGFMVVPYAVKPLIIRALEEKFHRPVAIREIHINPIHLSARVNGFTLGERSGGPAVLSVDELYVNLQAQSLLKLAPVIEEITVNKPHVRLVRNEDNSYNISDIIAELSKPSPPEARPARFSLNNIALHGGKVEFDDRPEQARHVVSDIEFSIPFVSNLDYATDIYVKPALSAKVNGAPFSLGGQSKPFSKTRESTAQIDIKNVDVPFYLKYVPVDLKFQVPSGRLDAGLTITFMQPPGGAPAITLSGKAALNGVAMTQGANGPLLSFPRLAVDIASADLVSRKVVLRQIALDRPELHVRREKGGGLNLARLAPETPAAPTAPAKGADKGAAVPVVPPFILQANEIKLAGGVVRFVDDSMARPFQARVQDLDLNVKNFTTEPGKPAAVEASFATDGGETFKHTGQASMAPLSVEGIVQLGRLGLKRYAPYYAGLVGFDVMDGALDLSTRYKVSADGGKALQVGLTELAGKLDALRLRQPGPPAAAQSGKEKRGKKGKSVDQADFLTIGTLALKGGALDLGKRSFTLDELSTTNGSVIAIRGADGQIDLANLMAPPASAKPAASASSKAGKPQADKAKVEKAKASKARDTERTKVVKSADTAAPWQFALKTLSVDGYAATLKSVTHGQVATLATNAIRIRASNLSNRKDSKAKLDLQARLGKSGRLLVNGDAAMNPLAARLNLDVRGLALLPLQPYFAEKINITVTDGSVGAKGLLQLGLTPGGALQAAFAGNARVDNLATVDNASTEDFLKWKSLRLRQVNAMTQPSLRIGIAEISLADFYSHLVINPDGSFNVQKILVQEDQAAGAPTGTGTPAGNASAANLASAQGAPVAAPAAPRAQVSQASSQASQASQSSQPAPPAAGKPSITIARLSLQNGHVDFHDHFIQPNYSADLTDLGGAVTGLSSDPGALADVGIKGRVNNQGQLDITGKVNPLSGNLFLDLLAKLTDFELSPLTPYAAKYAGYGIEKGKLSFDVKYRVEDRKLTAENHLILNQLTFGQKVDSPTATKLPVLFAVALLKDRHGNIDLNLPIAGSLDDPKFSMGGLIVKVIVNLIVKAVTAPFSLIANMFGGGQEMSHLEFDYGSAALLADAESKLKSLGTALHDRPSLKLDVAGRADPVKDAEGLKRKALDHKVKAQKLKALVKEGESATSADAVTIAPDEYPKYLAAAYDQEKIPGKPRSIIGLAKKLPVAEMEALMLANIKVSDDDLRELANQRAMDVKNYLVKNGQVGSERIFIVSAPAAKPEQEKLKQSRVDFSLGAK